MDYWNREAKLIVNGLLARAGVSHKALAHRLAALGGRETETSIAKRLSRGTFSVSFVFNVVAVLGQTEITLGRLTPDETGQRRGPQHQSAQNWIGTTKTLG